MKSTLSVSCSRSATSKQLITSAHACLSSALLTADQTIIITIFTNPENKPHLRIVRRKTHQSCNSYKRVNKENEGMTSWSQATFPGIYIVLRTSALSDSIFCFQIPFRAPSSVTREKLKHNNFDVILTCSFMRLKTIFEWNGWYEGSGISLIQLGQWLTSTFKPPRVSTISLLTNAHFVWFWKNLFYKFVKDIKSISIVLDLEEK